MAPPDGAVCNNIIQITLTENSDVIVLLHADWLMQPHWLHIELSCAKYHGIFALVQAEFYMSWGISVL